MKMAEVLSRQVASGEASPKVIPVVVRDGVVRYYTNKHTDADFAWAEWECSHSEMVKKS